MPRRLEFFTGGCPVCRSFEDEIEVGKCACCELDVVDVRDPGAAERMRRHRIRVVPTLVIDAKVKVEGRLDEPWICGDDLYARLEERFPLRPRAKEA